MSRVTCQVSMSLDGFVAGPDQSPDEPLGEGGERLHEWAYALESFNEQHGRTGGDRNPDNDVLAAATRNVGAYVMGRRMFGGGNGPWDPEWKGWWGAKPPFHAPVFVLTHHAREPLEMEGGTTFTFVTDGIAAALRAARQAAGDQDVAIAGGASVIQQYLAAGAIDELHLHIVPTLLGAGERLLENVGDLRVEPVDVVASPLVTHIEYRVMH